MMLRNDRSSSNRFYITTKREIGLKRPHNGLEEKPWSLEQVGRNDPSLFSEESGGIRLAK